VENVGVEVQENMKMPDRAFAAGPPDRTLNTLSDTSLDALNVNLELRSGPAHPCTHHHTMSYT